ncbi:IS607 family element RNA-guided endonuclease TnpB, partial [Lipingzhangella sp. LS1_29]
MTVEVTQAYRFALDLTPAQERDLARHAGAARLAYNWGLARITANLSQREAERSYGIADADLTPSVTWSLYGLRRAWNQAKNEVAPWWGECSKEAYNTGLDQLARGLKNWSDSRKGNRKGKPVGFPRFKSKRTATPSVKFTTGTLRLEDDRRHVTLPRVGTLKTHESTRTLHRRLTDGRARVLSATVRRESGRWFVSVTCTVQRTERAPSRPDHGVGVDLGITSLAVLSDGTVVDNPRHVNTAQRKLRRTSRTVSRRQGPDRRTGQAPSNRWRRANTARNTVHRKVSNQRRDHLHKLTTRLADTYGTVVVEDLHVAGMLANRTLARHVADAGFAEVRRQLEYKTAWRGGTLVVADRWFASSKTCSGCGAVKAKLARSERTFVCTECGLILDRDLNAAHNLAALVERHVAGSGSETRNGRGADRETGLVPAGGCEPSTPHREPSRVRRGLSPGNERIIE